jgi:hypothetical protein
MYIYRVKKNLELFLESEKKAKVSEEPVDNIYIRGINHENK